ncbi:MAG: SH3 domain-containing protein [Polyangiaceae bacterium]
MKLKPLLLGLPLLLLPSLAWAEVLSVKSPTANFREKPTEAAKIKFSADRFFPVEVLERKVGWVKVKDFEGDEAWVAERLLSKTSSIVVTAEKANIREEPNTTSDVLFKVERGEVFKVEEQKGKWLKVVDARGDGGWIRQDMTWGGQETESAAGDATDVVKTAVDTASDAAESEPIVKAAKPTLNSVKAKIEDAPAAALATPDNLQSLCRAYLDDAPAAPVLKSTAAHEVPKAVEKLEQISKAGKPEKPTKAEKKADKKSDKKADKKKADKKKADSKKADKKVDKKKADKKKH